MDVLVLLSGGIDSAACVAFYKQLGHQVGGVFVDYAQPVRKQEETCAAAIAEHYKIPLTMIRCTGPERKYVGEIAGRNAFLVLAALVLRPVKGGIIALGIHHGRWSLDC